MVGRRTLLRMLAGLESIDSGEIFINGESLHLDELEKRHLLGFVFQDFSAFSSLIRYGELDFVTHQNYGNV